MNSPVIIYTDGSCLGNPGPGGWGAVLLWNGRARELSGGVADTTNNRMEMTALIAALRHLKKPCAVQIYTDSQYVANGMNKWLPNWRRRGYRKADGKPVKNADLWQELDAAATTHTVEWNWVRGHDGNDGNEKAHCLANDAAVQAQQEKNGT